MVCSRVRVSVRVRVRVRVSPVFYPRGRASRGAPARDSACRGMTPVLFTLTGGLPGGRGGAGGARAARGQGVRVRGRRRHPANLRAHLQARERVRLTCTMALLAFWRSYYSMAAHLISPGTPGSSKTRASDESERNLQQNGVRLRTVTRLWPNKRGEFMSMLPVSLYGINYYAAA